MQFALDDHIAVVAALLRIKVKRRLFYYRMLIILEGATFMRDLILRSIDGLYTTQIY